MAIGKLNTDKVFSRAAVVIALCSLVLTLLSGYCTRQHNRLSLMPRLIFSSERAVQGPQIGVLLSNGGSGPALITSWIVSINNEEVPKNRFGGWDTVLQKLNLPFDTRAVHYANFRVLEAGKEQFIFSINHEDWNKLSQDDQKAFFDAIRRIKVVINYDSAYDEHYQCVFDGASQW